MYTWYSEYYPPAGYPVCSYHELFNNSVEDVFITALNIIVIPNTLSVIAIKN